MFPQPPDAALMRPGEVQQQKNHSEVHTYATISAMPVSEPLILRKIKVFCAQLWDLFFIS